jgi:hypothetical protein
MAEVVMCPECQRRLNVPAELAGRSVKCPTCGAIFTPFAATTAPVAPQPELVVVDDEPPPDDELETRMRRDMLPHRGAMVLVFGILGLAFAFPSICCVFTAIGSLGFSLTALILGHLDLRAMREHRMDPEGMGLTRGGWICGIIGTVVSIGLLLLNAMFLIVSLVNDM